MKRTIALFLLLLLPTQALAITSWDVTNNPRMFLDSGITTTQTANIKLAAPKRNGVTITYPTTTGGILRLTSPLGSTVEDLYYSSASVNASTKVVTLSGVIRNICFQYARTIVTCGAGKQFGKGSFVELNQDARLFNLKANIDRANTFSATQTFGSGVTLTGTTNILRVTPLTTAQRDALTDPSNGIIYNTDTSVMNQYVGGAWTTFASGTVSNATETTSGKAEAATIKDQSGSVAVGDSGAPLFVQTKYLTSTGSNATQYGRIATLGKNGTLTGSVLCTGNKNLNGGRNYCSGTGAWVSATPGTLYYDKTVYTSGVSSTGLVNPSVYTPFDTHTYTIPANDLIAGVSYQFECGTSFTYSSSTLGFAVMINNTTLASASITPAGSNGLIRGTIVGTAAAGAAVPVRGTIFWADDTSSHSAGGYSTVSEPTSTGTGMLLRFGARGSATNPITLTMCHIRKSSTTPF